MNKRISMIFFFFFILLFACSDRLETTNTEDIQSSNTIDEKNELVIAVGGEPEDGFDPTLGWGRYGNPLFQSTLLKYDVNFEIDYDLAKNYEISDDGLEWTIFLREDVKFSDGENFDADDVVFTFEKTKKNVSIVDLTNVEKIEAINPHEVKITLKEPDSTFIYTLTTLGIVPEHAYSDSYKEKPIGTGPYKLLQWDKGQQMIVDVNPNYYGDEPYFKKITFLFLDEDAAFAAAKAGEVDVVSVPATFGNEKIDGMKLVQLQTVDNRGIVFPFVPGGEMTEDGHPIGNDVTSDPAIRKAINIAIDRQELVDGVLNGFGTPAYSVVDQLPWWNEETMIEDNNLDFANEMLDEAGWELMGDGVREKNGLKAAFTLFYPAGDQIRQSLSMAVAQMLEPVGIKVTTRGESWSEIQKVMYSEPVLMGWGSHSPLEMYHLHSSNAQGIDFYNVNYYSNPKVDEYMENALRSTSQDEAIDWWKKAQWDGETGFSAKGDAPWAWLVNIDHLYFIDEDLEIGEQKIQPHGHGWPITEFILDWHWKR